jgi:hypothetical protein
VRVSLKYQGGSGFGNTRISAIFTPLQIVSELKQKEVPQKKK